MTKFSGVRSNGTFLKSAEMWRGGLGDDATEAQHRANRVLVDFKKPSDPSQLEHHSNMRQYASELNVPITFRSLADTLQKDADAGRIHVCVFDMSNTICGRSALNTGSTSL